MYTLEQARELLRNRRPEEALARFGARLPSAGDPAWIVIAEAWLRLGRPGEARASLGRAPATLDAGLVAVSVLEFEGRFTEARASLMALPPVPAVLLRRGNLGLRTADLDWAGESFTEALAGEPGLTRVARTLVSASNWPEALHNLVSVIPGFGADGMVYCCSLFPFESSFPALVLPAGCCTLTIRSMCSSYKGLTSATPIDEVQVCVGGGVRQITKSDGTLDEAFFRRGLEFPTIERTFTAPRTSPSGRSYFTVADLARALNKLPESFTQIGRRHAAV